MRIGHKCLAVAVFTALAWVGFGPAAGECKKIAVMWIARSAMVEAVVSGFNVQKSRIAPDLEIEWHKGLRDADVADRVFKDCESRLDGIVFLASPGAEYLASRSPKVSCFIGACNDPESLGVVKNPEAPDGNVTGVTYTVPIAKRFEVLKDLFPKARSVALLLTKNHPSSMVDQKRTKEECARRNMAYREIWASNAGEIEEGLKEVVGKVDLIIIGTSRVPMDNVASILFIANPAKVPVFSYALKPVSSGATAGMAADDDKLGRMLADSVVDVVVRNQPVRKVPIKYDPEPTIMVNEPMMKALGLSVPERLPASAKVLK